MHVVTLKQGTSAATIPNSACLSCHGAGSNLSPEKVHWVQEMANAANYQSKIISTTVKKAATATAAGTLSVKYAVVNPATGAAYDLREGCSAANTTDSAGTSIVGCNTNYRWDAVLPPAVPGKPTDKFGMFTIYLGVETLAGVTADDVTATASWAAYRGVDSATHEYTADVADPGRRQGQCPRDAPRCGVRAPPRPGHAQCDRRRTADEERRPGLCAGEGADRRHQHRHGRRLDHRGAPPDRQQ